MFHDTIRRKRTQWPLVYCFSLNFILGYSKWEGGQGRREYGDKGDGEREDGGRGAGVGKFWGRGLYQNLLYFTDFTLFLCTAMQ